MTSPSLLKVLVERNIVAVRTEIDARYLGRSLGGQQSFAMEGTFLILAIHQRDGAIVFECADIIDGKRRMIPSTAVLAIDGMDPVRLAANYNLDAEGNPVKVGKRRGRKPRALLEAEAAAAATQADAFDDEDEDEDEFEDA